MPRTSGRARTAPGARGAWREQLAAVVERAPSWMRERASAALHIGGFTNVRLEHPVLDVAHGVDDADAVRAATFFLAAALLHGAALGRIQCGSGERARALATAVRRALRGAVERVDDENAALLRYVDVFLRAPEALDDATGARLARAAARAVGTRLDSRGPG